MVEIALPTDFTLEDLLGALGEQEQEEAKGFHTRREWEEILGISKFRITKLLHLALKKGMLVRARQKREGLDHVWRLTTVYAFKVEPQ